MVSEQASGAGGELSVLFLLGEYLAIAAFYPGLSAYMRHLLLGHPTPVLRIQGLTNSHTRPI
jgi:hypothetical protein